MQRKAGCRENALSSKAVATMGLGAPVNNLQNSAHGEDSAENARQPLVPLSFKVTKSFKKRYQQAALNADMKLNEFLSAMLDHWEKNK